MLLANFNQKEHLRHRAVLLAAAQLSCCILAAVDQFTNLFTSSMLSDKAKK